MNSDLDIAFQFATSHLESVPGVTFLLVAAVPSNDGDGLETMTAIGSRSNSALRCATAHLNDQVVKVLDLRPEPEEEEQPQ
jgi:hypothetical protein